MITVIAVLCSLTTGDCHEQTVTDPRFEQLGMTACMVGVAALADWMKQYPQYRLGGWKCRFGGSSHGA